MILLDSSVLIGYLKGDKGKPFDTLDTLIEREIPFGICPLVYQEVLQGAKNEKEFKLLKEYLGGMATYDVRYGKKSYEEAALMYFKCRKAGVTPRGTVDMIIAQTAIENHLMLLHSDRDYVNIASVISELKLL